MKINAILSMIGKHTLSIYMMQFFLFRFINLETLFSLLYEGHNYFAIFFISALIAILICYLCMLGEWILMKSQLLSFFVFWEKYVIRKIQETGCNQLDSFINITVDFGLC